jgi:hypothetical protein
MRHFEGLLAPIGFEPCSHSWHRRFRKVFLEIRELTARHLDNTTLAQIAGAVPVPEAWRSGHDG